MSFECIGQGFVRHVMYTDHGAVYGPRFRMPYITAVEEFDANTAERELEIKRKGKSKVPPHWMTRVFITSQSQPFELEGHLASSLDYYISRG